MKTLQIVTFCIALGRSAEQGIMGEEEKLQTDAPLVENSWLRHWGAGIRLAAGRWYATTAAL